MDNLESRELLTAKINKVERDIELIAIGKWGKERGGPNYFHEEK